MSDAERIKSDIAALGRAFGRMDLSSITRFAAYFGCGSEPQPVTTKSTESTVPENKILIALLHAAEGWAARARTSLVHMHTWDRATLVAGRRPEERALMAAAMDAVDLVRSQPGGIELLNSLGVACPNPESSEQLRDDALRERLDWVRQREFSPRMGE